MSGVDRPAPARYDARGERVGGPVMMNTIWAEVRDGKIVPLEEVRLAEGAKILVTILTDEDESRFWLGASQVSLAEIWDNDQDDVYAQLLKE
jgi:hypothetical protein